MILRDLNLDDLDQICEIENQSFSNPWSKEMFLGSFLSPNYRTIVSEENGEILGYMSIIATKDIFEIINIAVKKERRNLKIGTTLILKAKEICKNVDASQIYLEVRPSNTPAINLYKKQGFKVDGIRPKYYGDEDAILMSYDSED